MGLFGGLFGGGEENAFRGYDYYVGCQFIACVGPVDRVREIRVEDRVAYTEGSSVSPPTNLYLGCSNSGTTIDIQYSASQDVNTELAEVVWTGDDGSGGSTVVDDDIGVVVGEEQIVTIAVSAPNNNTTYTVKIRTINEWGASAWLEGTITTQTTDIPLTFKAAEPTAGDLQVSHRITISQPRLFGADDSGGGIIGDVDVSFGETNQGVNDYLVANGVVSSAFRGLLTFVLRHVNIGMSPYMKPWAFRVQRCFRGQDGAAQWYQAKSGIPRISSVGDAAIFYILDISGSMNTETFVGSGYTYLELQRDIAHLTFDELSGIQEDSIIDLKIVGFNVVTAARFLRRSIDAAGWSQAKSWVSGLFATGNTNFEAAVSEAQDFFDNSGNKRRILVMWSDGQSNEGSYTVAAQVAQATGAEIYCFNTYTDITSQLEAIDNTPNDGVPSFQVAQSVVPFILGSSVDYYDMNFVHIIRECLTNTEWGGSNPEANMGTTWTAAADVAFAEGFGLSFIWNRESEVEDVIKTMQAHGDAAVYIDRRTGLWEIKLIRNDYNPLTLPVFDDTNILKHVSGPDRHDPINGVNDLTLVYHDHVNDKQASRALQDLALVQESGRVNHDSVEYEGISYPPLAIKVLNRDLKAATAPLATGEIAVNRDGDTLNPGDVFIINQPRYGLNNEICRVVDIKYGGILDEQIKIQYSTDVFSLDDNLLINAEQTTLPVAPALEAPEYRMVEEGTYFEAVRRAGQSAVDSALATSPDQGYLFCTSEKPAGNPLRADIYVNTIDEGDMQFAPVTFTTAEVGLDPTVTAIATQSISANTLLKIRKYSLALIGSEIIRIDARTTNQLTVGRGCLDTVPAFHPVGTPIIFFGDFYSTTDDEYQNGTGINVKLLPVNSAGILDYNTAPTDSVTFASRMIRPMPVGNLKGNGAYQFLAPDDSVDMVLTWNHRDRTAEISDPVPDYADGDVGPETSVTYDVDVVWVDNDGADISTYSSVNVGTAKTYTVTSGFLAAPPAGAQFIEFRVRSLRNGYNEWQTPTVRMLAISSGFTSGFSTEGYR